MLNDLYEEMFLNEQTHWWFLSRSMIIKKVLNSLLPRKDNLQMLGAGCGAGGNTKANSFILSEGKLLIFFILYK